MPSAACLCFALALGLPAATTAPEQVLSKVQSTYKQGGDLSASFTQVYVDKLRGKKKSEAGHLWAAKDGKVRWAYETPVKKDFYFTGKAAYFYEPENAQVTVFDKFEDSPLWNAMRFLWGQGSLSETFAVKECDAACPKPGAGEAVLWLAPKEPVAAVDHVVLIIDTAASRVKSSLVYDALGNRTEYHFTDLTFGQKLDPKKFQFEVPKGVSVLRASSEGK